MSRVSVVMNVWNGAETLAEVLDSVLAQTFADWDLIVWDDRSTDDSAVVVQRIQDPRIRYYLAPEHTPLGEARKLAIQRARGEWVAFLDQDDLWLPHKLERQLAAAASDPEIDMVYGRTMAFCENGNERDFDHRHEFRALPEGNIFEDLFQDSCFIAMSSVLIRRSALERIGEIPSQFEVIPDYHMFVAVAHAGKVKAIQDVICRYRLHDNSMSHSHRVPMHEEALLLIEDWAKHLNPSLLDRRRKVHSTVLSVCHMQSARSFFAGLHLLFTRGSLPYLLSRPVAIAYRTLKRQLVRPYGMAR